MQLDNTTFNDLSIFHQEEEFSIFNKLNFTQTVGGRQWLVKFFSEPLNDIKKIAGIQQMLKRIADKEAQWPTLITNGTVMVLERFYESPVDAIPSAASLPNALMYKALHGPDFSLVKYSVGHFADFINGFQQLVALFDDPGTPAPLSIYIQRAAQLLKSDIVMDVSKTGRNTHYSPVQTIRFGYFFLYRFKSQVQELIDIYGRLDAWYSMAKAIKEFKLVLPEFVDSSQPVINARGLYHTLLRAPVSYDIQLDTSRNFLFLTGANMAGKSTFIKSMGAAVYLAHLGMGVPAQQMQLSLFDGILSNINVEDNIVKGESYFFNEVQRIKSTIEKISDGKNWLILIDELFKGTNQQDAVKCSTTVIEGLRKMQNALFILSTHLYEIGADLRKHNNIQFHYFETSVKDDQLIFSYQLKEGISNDRLGYLILRKEGVVDLLEKL